MGLALLSRERGGKKCFIEAFSCMDEAHFDYGEQSVCLKSADLLNFHKQTFRLIFDQMSEDHGPVTLIYK